jgi:hypothetical protein
MRVPGRGRILGHRTQSGVGAMQPLLKEIRHTPLLWMLVFVPAVLVAEKAAPHSHTLLFVLAVLAIVPVAIITMVTAPGQNCRLIGDGPTT